MSLLNIKVLSGISTFSHTNIRNLLWNIAELKQWGFGILLFYCRVWMSFIYCKRRTYILVKLKCIIRANIECNELRWTCYTIGTTIHVPWWGFEVPLVVAVFEADESSTLDEFMFDAPFSVFITTGWVPSWESEATERFEPSFIGVTFLFKEWNKT